MHLINPRHHEIEVFCVQPSLPAWNGRSGEINEKARGSKTRLLLEASLASSCKQSEFENGSKHT